MSTTDMDPRTADYLEAARVLWQLHKSLRPGAPMVRHKQVTLALSVILHGTLSTEEERLELVDFVGQVAAQEGIE